MVREGVPPTKGGSNALSREQKYGRSRRVMVEGLGIRWHSPVQLFEKTEKRKELVRNYTNDFWTTGSGNPHSIASGT